MIQPAAPPYEKVSHPLGAHCIVQEGPILFFASAGGINLTENQAMFGHMERVKREYGRVFLLIDGGKVGHQEPDARAWAARNVSDKNIPDAVVMFGATFPIRVAITLFNRAVRVFARVNVPLSFFATETEAREFLRQLDQKPRIGQ